jgi:hypothetical protein
MKSKQLDDGTYVVTTAPDLSGLAPVVLLLGLLVLASVGALVGFAMAGNVIAALILGSAWTLVIVAVTVKLANSVRHTELEGRTTQAVAGSEQWRLNMEERLALTDSLATVQNKQAKTTQSTVAAMMAATRGAEDPVTALDLDSSYDFPINGT